MAERFYYSIFLSDPFLDGKPMKLSKNGSDVICVFAFHDSSCSSILYAYMHAYSIGVKTCLHVCLQHWSEGMPTGMLTAFE